jgi:Domain of unknown function (DUF4124)
MQKIISIAIAAFLVAPAVMAEGEVYRWKDSNNTWHYSDQPQPGAELVKKLGTRTSSSNSSPPASAPRLPDGAVSATSDSSAPSLSPEVTQQVRREAATAKAEQCKKAREAYTRAVQARRIVKKDEAGKQVYLNEAEIDAARLEARANQDLACGP